MTPDLPYVHHATLSREPAFWVGAYIIFCVVSQTAMGQKCLLQRNSPFQGQKELERSAGALWKEQGTWSQKTQRFYDDKGDKEYGGILETLRPE